MHPMESQIYFITFISFLINNFNNFQDNMELLESYLHFPYWQFLLTRALYQE